MSRARTIKFIAITSLAMVSAYRLPDVLLPVLDLMSGKGVNLAAGSPLLNSVSNPALQQALANLPANAQAPSATTPTSGLDLASLLGGSTPASALPAPPLPAAKPDPEKAKALVNQAVALHSAGQLPEAISAYRAILERTPDDAGMRLNLAVALLQSGDAEAASAELEKAAVLGRTPPEGLLKAVEAQLAAAGG